MIKRKLSLCSLLIWYGRKDEKIKLQAKSTSEKGQKKTVSLVQGNFLLAANLHPKDGQRNFKKALEVFLSSGKSIFKKELFIKGKKKKSTKPLFLGIKIFKEELHRKINQRVLDIFVLAG